MQGEGGLEPFRIDTERPPDCEIPGQRGGALNHPVGLAQDAKEEHSMKLCKFCEVRSEESEISSLSDGKVRAKKWSGEEHRKTSCHTCGFVPPTGYLMTELINMTPAALEKCGWA